MINLSFYIPIYVNDAKLGSKAGNFLSGKRGGGGERQIDREKERQTEK